MKPISKTSDHGELQKSLDILNIVGYWKLHVVKHGDKVYRIDIISEDTEQIWFMKRGENFFTQDENGNPHLMALAWRVLNWADQSSGISQTDWHIWKKYLDELLPLPPSRRATSLA